MLILKWYRIATPAGTVAVLDIAVISISADWNSEQ